MKSCIELHFRYQPTLILERVLFRCSLLAKERYSVRGKSAWRIGSTGSFEWSAAVRSLSKLFLNAAIDRSYALAGEDARSLDFAIAKDPVWLQEMFCDDANRKLTRRLFVRSNPEGKRPIPQTVNLSKIFWQDSQIAIFVDGSQIESKAQLQTCATHLTQREVSHQRALDLLGFGMECEIESGLANPQILDDGHIRKLAKIYFGLEYVRQLGGKRLLSWMASYASCTNLGLTKQQIISELQALEPISILAPPAGTGNAALLRFLRDRWGIPLILTNPYATAYYTVRALVRGEINPLPELFSAGIVPAIHLDSNAARHDYVPFAPGLHGLGWQVQPQSTNDKILYFREEPSNLGLLTNLPNSRSTQRIFTHVSHAEIIRQAASGELNNSALVIGVYGPVVAKLGIEVQRTVKDAMCEPFFVFLARKDFAETRRAQLFKQALRRGFAAMLFEDNACKKAARSLMNDEEVVYQLLEEGGMFGLGNGQQ